jgi:hypothetical protein
MEIWKDIEDFKGYQVSNLGNVKSLDRNIIGKNGRIFKYKSKYLTQRLNKKRYLEVRFCINSKHTSKIIHRLVAKAFIPNPDNKPQVNHINGIKSDNKVENLEWCSNGENQIHAFKLGLNKAVKGEKHHNAVLTNNMVDNIITMYNNGKKIIEISKELNIKLHLIRPIIYGFGWKWNKIKINKRDERKDKSKLDVRKSIISSFYNKGKSSSIPIVQIENNNIINTFYSISNASKSTGIPRKSIEAVVNNKMNRAGGYDWEKIKIEKIENYI